MNDEQSIDGDVQSTVRRGDAEEATRRVEPSESSMVASSPAATVGLAPVETLLAEEIERTRVFTRVAIVVATGVGLAAPFLGGDGRAKAVLYVGLALIVASCGWLSWKLRDDTGYTPLRWTLVSLACLAGVFTGIYYFGPFSPAPVALPFGLFFFSLSQNRRATLAVFALLTLGYAGLVIATMTGLVVDRGLVSSESLPIVDRLVMLAVIESVLGATYAMGRATRRAAIEGVERHELALRRLLQREALLREARQELELAMQAGAIGRYTDVRLGSYQLGTLLGRGGMGEVYGATHLGSGDEAAVKVLRRHLLGEGDNLRRFLREAQIVKQLDTPHVVRVLEVGDLDAATPYIAMERLNGEDLAEKLRRLGRLSLRATLTLLREVAKGLEAAHAAGVIHRDIKPRNLFRAELGNARRIWKILDFGVSKLAHTSGTLTGGGLIGTPSYMAPEQALRGDVTPLSDAYALAVIGYRALTGRPAFAGVALPDTLYKVVHTMPPRPSAIAPMPAALDDVLAIALAKKPADRFQSLAELCHAFELAVTGHHDEALRERAHALLEAHPWSSHAIESSSSIDPSSSTATAHSESLPSA